MLYGSEILAKDVLEYVVFEKHVANEYGKWRVHDKIIPDWLPPKEPSAKTIKLQPIVNEEEGKADDVAIENPEQSKPAQITA